MLIIILLRVLKAAIYLGLKSPMRGLVPGYGGLYIRYKIILTKVIKFSNIVVEIVQVVDCYNRKGGDM